MLDIQTLNTKVLYNFFNTLFQYKLEEYNLTILQDRQSSARPVNPDGTLKTYLFYRVESPIAIQWQTTRVVPIGDAYFQRTITQRHMAVQINYLGTNAANAAAYFDHAINSELAYMALRPYINGVVKEFQYNNHTPAIDLTEIEQTKWVSRYQSTLKLGYIDYEDFPLDVFDKVEVTEHVLSAGAPVKLVVKGE